MPLDEHSEGGHGERESGLELRPDPVHDLLEVIAQRQHRQHRLHPHAVLPLATLTPFEVGGIALRGMKAGITVGEATSEVLTAFSPSPPPNRTGYFRIIRLSSFPLYSFRIVSALRLTRTSASFPLGNLLPFAVGLLSLLSAPVDGFPVR